MNARQRYKMYHSYLRRALNAGARGYLDNIPGGAKPSDFNAKDLAARAAAAAAIKATGRQPAPMPCHALFYSMNYGPGRVRS